MPRKKSDTETSGMPKNASVSLDSRKTMLSVTKIEKLAQTIRPDLTIHSLPRADAVERRLFPTGEPCSSATVVFAVATNLSKKVSTSSQVATKESLEHHGEGERMLEHLMSH